MNIFNDIKIAAKIKKIDQITDLHRFLKVFTSISVMQTCNCMITVHVKIRYIIIRKAKFGGFIVVVDINEKFSIFLYIALSNSY